jgi:hypothetical protein
MSARASGWVVPVLGFGMPVVLWLLSADGPRWTLVAAIVGVGLALAGIAYLVHLFSK